MPPEYEVDVTSGEVIVGDDNFAQLDMGITPATQWRLVIERVRNSQQLDVYSLAGLGLT